MSRRIFIVSPRRARLKKLSRNLNDIGFRWVYLGSRIDDYESSIDSLGDQGLCSKIDISNQFQEIAAYLREPYLAYLYSMGEQIDSLAWWVSSLSYRQGSVSNTFENSCYLAVALGLVKNCSDDVCIVLVVSDLHLRRTIAANINHDGELVLSIDDTYFRLGYLSDIYSMAKLLIRRGYFIFREIRRIMLARWIIRDCFVPSKPTTLIVSSLSKRNVDRGAEFHSSFFGRLGSDLAQLGFSTAFMPLILRIPKNAAVSYKTALRKVQQNDVQIIVPHRYLHVIDVIKAVVGSISKIRLKGVVPLLEGLDISILVRSELHKNWISNGSADAYLMVAVTRRWALLGVNINRVIYVFENQPWERAVCWGFRTYYPESVLIGYQHARTPRFMLNFYLAADGEAKSPLPDRVVTNGHYTANLLASSGYTADQVRVGGALQMQDSLTLGGCDELNQPLGDRPTVLFAASEGREETIRLVQMALHMFDESSGIDILVKCHPIMPFENISGYFTRPLPNHVKISNESILLLIQTSYIMIYTGSTVCVQALAMNLPVIHVCPEFGFDMDPLEAASDSRIEAMGLNDLRDKVNWLLENRDEYIESHRSQWEELVKQMYSSVTSETLSAFTD